MYFQIRLSFDAWVKRPAFETGEQGADAKETRSHLTRCNGGERLKRPTKSALEDIRYAD